MPPVLQVRNPFVAGLALGRPGVTPALCVLYRTPGAAMRDPVNYRVELLRRWPVATTPFAIAEDIHELALQEVLHEQLEGVVVTALGLGVAALRALLAWPQDFRAVPAWLAGERAKPEGLGWSVPPRDMISALQLVMDERVTIPDVQLAGELIAQLEALEVRETASGRETYQVEAGAGDDLLTAFGLAVWWSEVAAPSVVEWAPDPKFSAFSLEARMSEYEKRRVRNRQPPGHVKGPMPESI